MHILLLNDDSIPTARGGTAVVVEYLRHAYHAQGHRVTLITTHQNPEGEDIERSNDAVGEIIRLKRIYNLRKRSRRALNDANMNTHLQALFAELQPDVVHAHNLHAYLTYNALCIARKYTPAIVLTAPDTFLFTFGRLNSERYRRDTREGKTHRMHWWEHIAAVGRRYWPLRNRAIRSMLHRADVHVVSISDHLAALLTTHGVSVTHTIHNGMPAPTIPSASTLAAFQNKHSIHGPVVFYGGRISTDKGIENIVRAFTVVHKTHPKTLLLIAGDKERIEPHLTDVSTTLRDNIRTSGWMKPQELACAFECASLVTTPSQYCDPFNLMNIEAMYHKKPVVGTCFGGTPEIVQHDKTGLIVDPTNTHVYADALLQLLENNDHATNMGAEGKKRAEAHFTVDRQANDYLALFERMLANKV